ncbi:MAG: hypothetical protein JJT99_10785 [Rhodobacteraceae bacterium]|nr:hypothetical protein [Paracoccaceae bacterium]
MPFSRFARNIALLSLAGLVPTLALYVALSPGLWSMLASFEDARSRFLRQIATNGLPVVFAVNAVSLILFARIRAARISWARALAFDVPARIIVFIGLHLVIYPASALAFGSFGGDPVQALRVVFPTLAQSAGFANLSGVYLYATLVSALPLHMALLDMAAKGQGRRQPGLPILISAALVIFAGQAMLLTAVAALISAAL